MTELTSETSTEKQNTYKLTIADGLFILVGMFAAIMRLTELSKIPVSAAEAQEALAVWQFWQPGTAELAISSPAYFTFTAMLTPILGVSDSVMRLVPALFGVGLVLLPWLLQKRLSTVGALITAVLLTVSPMAAAIARTAGGDSIALFAALLLLIAWINGRDSRNGRWFYAAMIALALGLTSSPLFYSALLTMGVAWLGQHFAAPHLFSDNEEGENWKLETDTVRSGLIIGGILLALISSFFLLSLGNVGAAASILGDWVQQFGGSSLLENIMLPFLAIVRYETALLAIGVVAILWAAWHSQPLPVFCIYWLLGIILLWLTQPGIITHAALIMLPLYLLIGAFSGAIIGSHIGWYSWLFTSGLLVLWAFIVANSARFLRLMSAGGTEFSHLWLAFFALAIILTTIFFALNWDTRVTYQGVLLSVLVMLLFYNWGTAWWLSHQAANDPRESWVNEGTNASILILADVIQDLSWKLNTSDMDVHILSTIDTPTLRWYLRQYQNIEFGKTAPSDTQSNIVITPAEAITTLSESYMGSDYLISNHAPTEKPFTRSPILDTLRWWAFHQSPIIPAQERVILWVKLEQTQ
ncbi:MAG: hypothetical protein CSA11_10215 [Chloroflexi bacterium]|nr:MAG: hypothetical protein CSA11_10215 [Chloroflexota bacterium]